MSKSKYEDIIHLPHFVSKNRRHMSNHDRAAQFAPFAALTGYDSVIKSREDVYLEKKELSEDEYQVLNETIAALHRGESVSVTYYNDGMYETIDGSFRLIDPMHQYMDIDHYLIPMENIMNIRKK